MALSGSNLARTIRTFRSIASNLQVIYQVWAAKHAAIASTGTPAIVTLKNVGELRPRHRICAVALTIDGQLGTPDRHRPWIRGGIAHRDMPEGLVGIGSAVAAGHEDRDVVQLRQLLQDSIHGAHIVG